MIVARSPLRLSLGGGGTDLKSYYSIEEGYLVAGAINKYVYVAIHEPFINEIILKYSEIENVKNIKEIKHDIFREGLNLYEKDVKKIEITSFADIHAGTGLGSSSTFTNSLIAALFARKNIFLNKEEIARKSCNLEIEILNEPIGKQDQYISAYGGIREFTFKKDGSVKENLIFEDCTEYKEFSDNLVLVYTGTSRSASNILKDQKEKTENLNDEMLKNLNKTKEIGRLSKRLIISKHYEEYGRLMHEHWQNKKRRSKGMSNNQIDEIYNYGLRNGGNGGKVIGAGGGGFILFQSSDTQKLKTMLKKKSLQVVDFEFTNTGTEIIKL